MARNDDRPVPNEYIIYLGSIHHTSRVHTVPRPRLVNGAAVHCQGGCSISVLAHHAASRGDVAVEASDQMLPNMCACVPCRSCFTSYRSWLLPLLCPSCLYLARLTLWPLLYLGFLIVRERVRQHVMYLVSAAAFLNHWEPAVVGADGHATSMMMPPLSFSLTKRFWVNTGVGLVELRIWKMTLLQLAPSWSSEWQNYDAFCLATFSAPKRQHLFHSTITH